MRMEEPCINEEMGLLQDCLPGVTLHNRNAYHHQRCRSDSSSRHPQEIDQLQQQILISKEIDKTSSDDCDKNPSSLSIGNSKRGPDLATIDESSSIRVLWINESSKIQSYSDDDYDDLDDIASYSYSIRQAAAISEAKRRSEERWFYYSKCFLIFAFCLLLWDELQPTKTEIETSDIQSTNNFADKFRFNEHWNEEVNSMYLSDQAGRNGDEKEKILIILKDLDEAIYGNIVLRSNKTKFLDAARVWQQQDCIVNEVSPSSEKVPPLAVVEATSVDDVQLSVPILGGLARDYGLGFRIRSGGHAYMSGYSTISGGIMLNLAKLNSIAIQDNQSYDDKEEVSSISNTTKPLIHNETVATRAMSSKTVVMGPGVRTEDFMKQVLDGNGYSGIVASAAGVGMGGFVLGGGYGLQSRMYGLAIDNVLGFKVVLPSGERKDVKEGDDLFWALCGAGGGNIGVVTSIEYKVYPSHDIKLAASVKVTLLEMAQILQRIGNKESDIAPEFTLKVDGYSPTNETLTAHQNISRAFVESNVIGEGEEDGLVTIHMYWMGDSNPDDPVGMQYIKKEILPLFPKSFKIENFAFYYFSWSGSSREREQDPELKSVWSAQSWNGFLLPSNNTQEVWTDIQSSLSAMLRYCKYVSPSVELWGGAISKFPSNATVFPYRNTVYNIGINLIVPSQDDAGAASDEMHLVNAIWPSIARHLVGAYVNYPMASLSNESYPIAYWGENLNRLVSLADRYDPSRVLKVAQGIPTALNRTMSPTQL